MAVLKDTCILYDVVFSYKGQLIKFAVYAPDEYIAQEISELQIASIIKESSLVMLGAPMASTVQRELDETNVVQLLSCVISKGY